MKVVTLEKDTLPVLLNKFEECASVINYNRAVALKIVDTIHRKKLLQTKSNYSKEQLRYFKEKHNIEDPWNYSTKDILEALYPFFSWSQYAKYGSLISDLDLNMATKLSEGAFVSLYRVRNNIHTLVPYLEGLNKKIISEEDVILARDANLKSIKKPIKRVKDCAISIPKNISVEERVRCLTKGYREMHTLSRDLEKEVDSLKKALRAVTDEKNDLQRQVLQYKNELRRR